MIVLALRTDKQQAELYLYDGSKKVAEIKWQAHLKLAETLNKEVDKILNQSNKTLVDLKGIVCFKGPGSFTGLRIGLTVANALAYAQEIPVVTARGDDWLSQGINKLVKGRDDKIVLPYYGRPANITKPKK